MSLAELLPTVRSLSKFDKLRLIQWIAEDLAGTEDASLNLTGRIMEGADRVEPVGRGDIRGGVDEERSVIEFDEVTSTQNDQLWPLVIEAGQSVPIWSPNESYEAAAIMWRMLEAEKSTA